jgi:hypothetical protein
MDKLPDDIFIKIMMYNAHPLTDILKESSIFKYLQLREDHFHDPFGSPFIDGCRDAGQK